MPVQNHHRVRFQLGTILISMLLPFGSVAVGQTSSPARQFKFDPKIDVSAGFMGEMTLSRNEVGNLVLLPTPPGASQYFLKSQSSSPSVGGLSTLHVGLKPYLGFNVNFSYSQFKQDFSSYGGTIYHGTATGYGDVGSLNTRMYEFTASYVFEGPRIKRFRTFGQFGGGGLLFQPISAYFAKEETRPAMVFGAGTEFPISPHFSIRAEYRGLLYKGPNYQTAASGSYPQQRLLTMTSLPAISFVYNFKSPSFKKKASKRHWGPY